MKALNDLKTHWKQDLTAGFILSLIALPLCIGIAGASIGNGSLSPAVSGLIAAVIGGVIVSRFSGAHVAIHGPAAGLIVIVQHGIESLSFGDPKAGFQRFLAAMIVAGGLQVLTGILKLGRFAALFPANVIHGMLAAIGVIIISKQIHVALGVSPVAKSPVSLYAEIPNSVRNMNPEIAIIGLMAIVVMVFFLFAKWKLLKRIPGPLVAVIVAAIMGIVFDLQHEHHYFFMGRDYVLSEKFLVTLPASIIGSLPRPDFSMVFSPVSLITIFSIYFVASLESLLSANAVDKLDLEKRSTNLNKEIIANGFGNSFLGAIGGLPIIAEIVRSSANVSNGARTQWSNFFHGIFLALFLFLIPGVIHMIPNAALAGILIMVGYRLANPAQLKHVFHVGGEQLLIFLTTLIVTVVEDLLVGVAAGLVMKIITLVVRGVNPLNFFKLKTEISEGPQGSVYQPTGPIIFTNVISLTGKIEQLPAGKTALVDFSRVSYVDHTSMALLADLRRLRGEEVVRFENLDKLHASARDPLSARKA